MHDVNTTKKNVIGKRKQVQSCFGPSTHYH